MWLRLAGTTPKARGRLLIAVQSVQAGRGQVKRQPHHPNKTLGLKATRGASTLPQSLVRTPPRKLIRGAEARTSKPEESVAAARQTTQSLESELRSSTAAMKEEVGRLGRTFAPSNTFQSQLQESIEALEFLELNVMLQPAASRPSAKRPNKHMELDDKDT